MCPKMEVEVVTSMLIEDYANAEGRVLVLHMIWMQYKVMNLSTIDPVGFAIFIFHLKYYVICAGDFKITHQC